MGAEAKCQATWRGTTASGKARLETSVLEFRGGDLSLTIPFADFAEVAARAGRLTFETRDGSGSLELGADAEKWAKKILHPPTRLSKLGVKPSWRASALGITDQTFLSELESAVKELTIGRVAGPADAIFLQISKAADLARLERLKERLAPAGALWLIRPKGDPNVSERAVMQAGKEAGLVDVKVVAFSSTHTAEKFVIPIRDRRTT